MCYVLYFIAIHLVGSYHVCVTCHINGAYISAPSSVHYSFQMGKQQGHRQFLTYAIHMVQTESGCPTKSLT